MPKSDRARVDPYRDFRFRILWDGRTVAGASRVAGLGDRSGNVRHREGAGPGAGRPVPGGTSFDAITIERGITHDAAFERWANEIRMSSSGTHDDIRKNLRIEMVDEAGRLTRAYDVRRCWPSESSALREPDSQGSALVIERLVLQNEGWERDLGVVEPSSPAD